VQDSGRIADDCDAIRHVGCNNSTGPDNYRVSNVHMRQNDGPGANKCAIANSGPTGKTRVAAHVRSSAYKTVVFHGRVVIHNRMIADNGIDLNNRTGKYEHALSKPSRGIDAGRRMRNCEPRRFYSGDQFKSPVVVTDGDQCRPGRIGFERAHHADNWSAANHAADQLWVVVEYSGNAAAACLRSAHSDLAVPTGANNVDFFKQLIHEKR